MTAVWTIFFMALIFIIIYIEQLKSSENKKNIMNEIIRTSVIIAIPFIIWMVYLLKTNSVEEWFYQAYKFNQEVYGKYCSVFWIWKYDLEGNTTINSIALFKCNNFGVCSS